jgi:hypothetical protein
MYWLSTCGKNLSRKERISVKLSLSFSLFSSLSLHVRRLASCTIGHQRNSSWVEWLTISHFAWSLVAMHDQWGSVELDFLVAFLRNNAGRVLFLPHKFHHGNEFQVSKNPRTTQHLAYEKEHETTNQQKMSTANIASSTSWLQRRRNQTI